MIEQYGVLPYRVEASGELRILLVTSRRTGRWVAPKGNPMPARLPHEAAAREAYEEAGIEGEIGSAPIGAFRYRKGWRFILPLRAEVTIFPLRVTRELDDWPEAGQRRREWFSRAEAAEAVREPGLRRLILSFEHDEGLSIPPR